MISSLVANTLVGMGIDVIDCGLSTTPTVEFVVPLENADGGIILTASHNPKQWNALKLLNRKGEFLNAVEGQKILDKAANDDYTFVEVDNLGTYRKKKNAIEQHIQHVLELDLVNADLLKLLFKCGSEACCIIRIIDDILLHCVRLLSTMPFNMLNVCI